MPVRRIFLASSEELREDREAFRLLVGQLNEQWEPRGWTFRVRVWEHFLDAMSPRGLQHEYNQAVRDCDIFVMLFFTKVGRFTREEFETAVADVAAGTGPRIYTYFRNDYVLTGELDDNVRSLLDFKARLKELKHYVTLYRNKEDLQFQFSRQLELLYGSEGAGVGAIDATMPQFKVGETALLLGYRQLFGESALDAAGIKRLHDAIAHATREVRQAMFGMASQLRRDTWFADKRRMERTIPVFEALAADEARWHAPHGQLGYALVDQSAPDWQRALQALDRAVELRGDAVREGLYYHYNRARCAVRLDPAFAPPRRPADAGTREAVLEIVRQARRDLGSPAWEDLLQQPDSADLRAWLQVNGSTPRPARPRRGAGGEAT
jgi:hypothetical protein